MSQATVSVAGRELVVSLRARRVLTVRMIVPLLLGVPLIVGHAPSFWASALLCTLVGMVGAVGAALAQVRGRTSGYIDQLGIVPRSSSSLVGEWMAASVAVDLLQMVPLLIVICLLGTGTPVQCGALIAMVVASLAIMNVMGAAVSLVASGPGDVLVTTAVVLAPLLFLGGLFTGVPTTGVGSVVATVDPFRYLDSAFINAISRTGAGTGATTPICVAAALTCALAVVVTAAMSRRLLGRP